METRRWGAIDGSMVRARALEKPIADFQFECALNN